jgi:hypothetical protein
MGAQKAHVFQAAQDDLSGGVDPAALRQVRPVWVITVDSIDIL